MLREEVELAINKLTLQLSIIIVWIFFCAAIDSQLQELNHRFSEHIVELLILGSALDPRVARESFRIDDICQLVNKSYPQDFTDTEKEQLEI